MFILLSFPNPNTATFKFSLLVKNDVESTIEKTLLLGTLKSFENLCKKLKIDFVECGESKENDDESDKQ